MAGRKATAKTPRKAATKAARKSTGKAPAKNAGKTKSAGTSAQSSAGTAKSVATGSAKPAGVGGPANIRVRMYRVGFGDFFLVTVPGKSGPAHILIDCGVHAANIGSMDACVKHMMKETGNKLALVILTHYHADHMSGFASNFNDFTQFEVGAVWITNRLDPTDTGHSKFMAQLTSVAQQLKMQLGARSDPTSAMAHAKVENALGVSENGGGGSNAKALKLLQSGFRNKPPVFYYQGGNIPKLPAELDGMITAEILGPSPKDSDGEFSASDNKTEQYLAALSDLGISDDERTEPFDRKQWAAKSSDYPKQTFDEYETAALDHASKRKAGGASTLEHTLANMQPDALAAAADKLDGTLNNQSLVVLFTCNGKKLLFVGDAQWGNWAYWLYGKAVTGSDPGISDRAKEILGSIDFYKVGHHGSTNATPIPAVGALNQICACMCSTATGAYGSPAKKTEVPRTALMDALDERTGKRLVRSDWVGVAALKCEPDPEAREELGDKLPSGFTTPGDLYIDYNL